MTAFTSTELTAAERESLGRVLTTANTLVTVVPGGRLASLVERIVAERVAAERERIVKAIEADPLLSQAGYERRRALRLVREA